MARPAFLLCDTDAVIQFLLAGQITAFRVLRDRYSIQPLIVHEVEIELRSHRKFGHRIESPLRKALANNLLCKLSFDTLDAHFAGQPAMASAAFSAIGKLGREYQKLVDNGEAYTHAAALTLGVPALSNDLSALSALVTNGLAVPSTVLRTFDLVALCHQVNEMPESECDSFRAFLAGEREYLPSCFARASFRDGLRSFEPRILDSSLPAIGVAGSVAYPFAHVVRL